MKKILIPALLLIIWTTLTGCTSILPKPREELRVVATGENAVCRVFVQSMTKEMLYDKFGKKNNPFIPPTMLLTPRYFYVFYMNIVAKQNTSITTTEIELLYKDTIEHPKDQQSILRFVETNSDSSNPTELRSLREKKEVLKKNLFPDSLPLLAGESYSSYIIFISSEREINPEGITIPATIPLSLSFQE